MKIGFDNDKYLKMQSEHIRERIGKFGGKLYLEFGGKLFDDYHASRVLPGFEPDSKLRLLKELSDQAEIVFAISAKDIEKNKIRGDLGITYDSDVIRLIGTYREQGLFVGSVVITQFSGQESALLFKNRLENHSLQHSGISIQHSADCQRERLRKERLYRDFTSTCYCNSSGTWKWKDGCLPVSVISGAPARNRSRICEVRNIPYLESATETPGKPRLRGCYS